MKKFLAAAAVAALSIAAGAPASASVMFQFVPGSHAPTNGFTVINTFDSAADVASGVLGVDFIIQSTSNSQGATLPQSVPAGTNYLSVLGGGTASVDFAPAAQFEFDWGSLDWYNTLVIHMAGGGSTTAIPGSNILNTLANGNQQIASTNGLFRVWGTQGELFDSITLSSNQNSFEVDNLAVAGIPEPAEWALMLTGFGGLGALMRRRRAAVAATA